MKITFVNSPTPVKFQDLPEGSFCILANQPLHSNETTYVYQKMAHTCHRKLNWTAITMGDPDPSCDIAKHTKVYPVRLVELQVERA